MSSHQTLPMVYLVRHGETAWSRSGQHTGLTDLPLTMNGEEAATRLAHRLQSVVFDHVYSSPLLRAHRTAELAGFVTAILDPDLVEWDYGEVEGLTTEQYRQQRPEWELFRDGAPGGESVAAISARADRVVNRLRQNTGTTLVVSSGHFLRVLSARWIGADTTLGRSLLLETASISILGYDRRLDHPVIRLWNDSAQLVASRPSG